MVFESMLGMLAVLACTAGFETTEAWHAAYRDWATIEGSLAGKLGAFIQGSARFMGALGVEYSLAAAFVAVIVVSFALTTLDSATRLLRFNVSELGYALRLPFLSNRFLATAIACGAIAWFAFYEIDGQPAGLVLWQLFGITNQLLAGLCLLVVTLYLQQRGKPIWFTGVPMAFMLVTTLIAMLEKIYGFWKESQWLLLSVGGALLVFGVLIVIEGVVSLASGRRETEDEIVLA
jgi:carbon starvation protein